MIVRIDNPEIFVGLEVEEAKRRIKDHGYDPVVIKKDGYTRMVPQGGYDPLRLKLVVIKDKVTEAEIG
jgi:hypothetical protein